MDAKHQDKEYTKDLLQYMLETSIEFNFSKKSKQKIVHVQRRCLLASYAQAIH